MAGVYSKVYCAKLCVSYFLFLKNYKIIIYFYLIIIGPKICNG